MGVRVMGVAWGVFVYGVEFLSMVCVRYTLCVDGIDVRQWVLCGRCLEGLRKSLKTAGSTSCRYLLNFGEFCPPLF